MKNKHGLSRIIPNELKYAIRRDAYFGCVHCGIAIGVYEHIDPEFADAKLHDPAKMTFLCDTQNQRKERGYLSKETIWSWKSDPWGKKNGHVHDSFDVDSKKFSIWIGGNKIENFEKIISIGDVCLLSVKPPEEKGAPFRLSAIFHDNQNNRILEIIDNEWKARSDVFDLICTNGKIGLRQNGNFILKIISFPPNQIVIEGLDMLYEGFKMISNQNEIKITHQNGTSVNLGGRAITSLGGFSFLSFSPDGTHFRNESDFSINILKEKAPSKPVAVAKFRRNEKCPCESGKKYKDCCSPKYDYAF